MIYFFAGTTTGPRSPANTAQTIAHATPILNFPFWLHKKLKTGPRENKIDKIMEGSETPVEKLQAILELKMGADADDINLNSLKYLILSFASQVKCQTDKDAASFVSDGINAIKGAGLLLEKR